MKHKLLGEVGVDSGQLLITDPCYIDSEWKDIQFKDIRMYQHKPTAKVLMYKSPSIEVLATERNNIELFVNYDSITSLGKSMNDLIAQELVVEMDVPEKQSLIGSFSYAGVCETTANDQHQLNYQLGHPGVAVAFSSGYGDGVYPVYGTFNNEGRCVKVEIDMGMTEVQEKVLKHGTTKKRPKKGSSK